MTELAVPDLALVVLVGASGSGKSTFARRAFAPFETLSSDTFRGLVANDENDQAATAKAFEALSFVAGIRLDAGLLTVVDATNVQPEARRAMIRLARDHDVLPVAIVLDVPEQVCVARTAARADRDFGAHVVKRQHDQLRRSMRFLAKEGFRRVHVLHGTDEVDAASIRREPLLNDLRGETGPFDVIGDVHGCFGELTTLLERLGWRIERDELGRAVDAVHPEGRRALFLGDLVDRGPDVPAVLRLAMGMVGAGHALAVPGNHEEKLVRALSGRGVTPSQGLQESLDQLAAEPATFRDEVRAFCQGLDAHLVLDGGRLVVAHAGLPEAYHRRASSRVRAFALYGGTTGETDEYGLPVRLPWADDYRGEATVLYGHTPTLTPEWVNRTMCLDTGCVFGGSLTALRYPERELVSVPAERVWYEPVRPLAPAPPARTAALRIDDVLGKQVVETRIMGRISVRDEQAAGALEVMSRFAIDPRRLIHLPPTMSPPEASRERALLEHPAEAFAAYRREGVTQLICEEKHMGSRALVLVARDPGRFDAPSGWRGELHTRTGRPFFGPGRTAEVLERLTAAIEAAGLWASLATDWLLLDAELLPWSLKAGPLIREQYASVGAAATSALPHAVAALGQAGARGVPVDDLTTRTAARARNAAAFVDAYRRYAGGVAGPLGFTLAPFQVLASEGRTYADRPHDWHLGVADALVAADPELVRPTRSLVVDTGDEASVARAVAWWTTLTEGGGEGMVVKPLANLVRGPRGVVQPGIKVRGREYLRIVYGPDYTEPQHLDRLRERDVGRKRSLALREYALGLEALERFVAREPTHRVHQAVFAVLALESDPIDPRL